MRALLDVDRGLSGDGGGFSQLLGGVIAVDVVSTFTTTATTLLKQSGLQTADSW